MVLMIIITDLRMFKDVCEEHILKFDIIKDENLRYYRHCVHLTDIHLDLFDLHVHALTQVFSFLYILFRLYQVRCSLKVSPGKLPIQLETCIPDQNANNTTTTGPCIINGAGASKVFQILYRNEEVSLRDVIMFRAHLLGKQDNRMKIYLNLFFYNRDSNKIFGETFCDDIKGKIGF